MQETNRVEFKRGLGSRLERSVVSFLNYAGGGEILIGVDNDGRAVGVSDPDAAQLQIVDRIRNNIRPQTLGLFDVVHTNIDGLDVIRVIVSCGTSRPYYIRKFGMSEYGCFIRVGSSSQPMSEQMIEEMISLRQRVTLQTTAAPRQNLTFKQLCIYYQTHNIEPTQQFLDSLDLRKSSGEYNYAAYLLADDNGVSIKIAVYAGTDKVDLIETREYGNRCLITSAQRILDRLDSENRTYARITSTKRIEKERVNTIALREAVINAIVHNDYTLGVPLVEIFSNRIVITSCGGLVTGLSEEDFFKCRSMPRNRELMRVFRDMDFVEQIGSGMTRMLKAYDRSIFELSAGFTVVTLPILENDKISSGIDKIKCKNANKNSINRQRNDMINFENDKIKSEIGMINPENDKINLENDSINNNENVSINDTINCEKCGLEREKERGDDTINVTINKVTNVGISNTTNVRTRYMLNVIGANPAITIKKLSQLTGVTPRSVLRDLQRFQDAGLIRREGARKNGRWVVV